MAGQIVIRSSPVPSSKQQLLIAAGTLTPPPPRPPLRKSSSNVGELAGGTTAECCAICCCCPCIVLEFLILIMYKVPANVCRMILKKRRQKKLMKKKQKAKGLLTGLGPGLDPDPGGIYHSGYYDAVSDVDLRDFETIKVSIDGSAEAVELDKKMWEQFHNAGFWRSHSRRHD